MFECISYKSGKYRILDTSDGVIETLSKSDVISALVSGIEIKGLELTVVNKGYKFRLYPNKEQEIYFQKCFGCCRFLWNNMLTDKIAYYKETGNMLDTQPPAYKNEYKFLKDVDSLEVGTEEYSTALENYNTILDEYSSLESAFSAKIDEFDSKEKEIIPSFTDNWNKLTLKESTDTENRYAAEPSVEYPYYVTWVKVTVNGNDYYNYSVNCIKQQEEVYVCKILDGKYYDKNGKVVSEEEYNKSCNPSCKVVDGKYYDNNGKEVSKDAYTKACGNPKTGNNMYYAYGAVIVVAACGLYMATRKVKKFSK